MHKLCQLNWKQTRFVIKIKAMGAGGVGELEGGLVDPLPLL